MQTTDNLALTIVMPALNEEKNIVNAINDTLKAFKELNLSAEILVVNDGSSDDTPLLVQSLIEKNPGLIRMLSHAQAMGLGASFWDGVDNAKGDIVCMLPGDNENEPKEILRYLKLMDDVDMVVPFVFNKEARPALRNFISFFYRVIINSTFNITLNYTNGTTLFRRAILKELKYRAGGFVYQADILIRLIKRGYLFAEVPYRLRVRKGGKSKAVSLRSLNNVIKGYIRLLIDIYLKQECRKKALCLESISSKRRQCQT